MEHTDDFVSLDNEVHVNPMKHVLTVIEKKVRNLEKRKVKLDGYKKILGEGGVLDKDQEIAINKYNEVVGSINFAKDLLHGFTLFTSEINLLKKKRMQMEQSCKEVTIKKTSQFIMQALSVLKLLSTDETVLKDVQSHKLLTENECETLIQFYKTCVNPQGQQTNRFMENLSNIENHVHLTCEGSNKPVCGTTYKHIQQCVDCLINSEYFRDLSLNTDSGDGTSSTDLACQEVKLNMNELENGVDPIKTVETETESTDELAQATHESSMPTTEDITSNKHLKLSVEDVLAEVTGQYNFFQDSLIIERDEKTVQLHPGVKTHPTSMSTFCGPRTQTTEQKYAEQSAGNRLNGGSYVEHDLLKHGKSDTSLPLGEQKQALAGTTHIPLPHEEQSGYKIFKSQMKGQEIKIVGAGDADPLHSFAKDSGNGNNLNKMSGGNTEFSQNPVSSSSQVSGISGCLSQHSNCFQPLSTAQGGQYSSFDKNFYLKDTFSNIQQYSAVYQDGTAFKASQTGHRLVSSPVKEGATFKRHSNYEAQSST